MRSSDCMFGSRDSLLDVVGKGGGEQSSNSNKMTVASSELRQSVGKSGPTGLTLSPLSLSYSFPIRVFLLQHEVCMLQYTVFCLWWWGWNLSSSHNGWVLSQRALSTLFIPDITWPLDIDYLHYIDKTIIHPNFKILIYFWQQRIKT